MSCKASIKFSLDIKATADEVEAALKAMDLVIRYKGTDYITTSNGLQFVMNTETKVWNVSGMPEFNGVEFRRQVQRSKILAEAKRQGYDVKRDEVEVEKLVVRVRIR